MKKICLVFAWSLFAGVASAQSLNIDSLNKLKVGIDYKPTKHKPGFGYWADGHKIVLEEWKCVGEGFINPRLKEYRWRCREYYFGQVIHIWTDDCWIDLYTGKSYYDDQKQRIIPIESK